MDPNPDPNLILTVTAVDVHAFQAIHLPHNEARYLPADEETPLASRATTPTGSGASTPTSVKSPSRRSIQGMPARLRLRLDQPPKDIKTGYVFGSDAEQCDVLAGRRSGGVSGRHFAINFDEQARLVLTNLSRRGTAVGYNGQGKEQRRKDEFTWLLLPEWKIRVHVASSDKCVFLLERPNQTDFDAQQHQRCLKPYFSRIFSPTFNRHSSNVPGQRRQRPAEPPVFADKESLGQGGFGVVYKSANVSTGEWVAIKRFEPGSEYLKEVKVMKNISHVRS